MSTGREVDTAFIVLAMKKTKNIDYFHYSTRNALSGGGGGGGGGGHSKFYTGKYISSNSHTVNQKIFPILWDMHV